MVKGPDIELPAVVPVERSDSGILPGIPGEVQPLGLLVLQPVGVAARPGLDRCEIPVVAHQRQPVRSGHHAKRVALQALARDADALCVLAFADVDLHRDTVRRRGDNRELLAGDLLDVGLQFVRRQLNGTRRFFGNNDLGMRTVIIDDHRRGAEESRRCHHQGKDAEKSNRRGEEKRKVGHDGGEAPDSTNRSLACCHRVFPGW